MEPLISVIIPVYNVEKYIRECIDSIINQSYENLEIILVDDDSPDNCGAICDEYAAKDSRVKVIHKENGGLSDARNAGMRISAGEYLVFADSDDYMTLDGIEYLYKLSKKYEADLVIGGSERFDDATGKLMPSLSIEENQTQIFDKRSAMKEMLTHSCAAWARLYKREIHKDVYFPVGEINEDEAIVLQILDRCEKIVKTGTVVYKYRYRPQSITSSSFSEKKLAWYYHCKANLEFIKEKYPDLTEYALARYYGSLLFSLSSVALLNDRKGYDDILKELERILKEEYGDLRKNQHIGKRAKAEAALLRFGGLNFYTFVINSGRKLKGAYRYIKNVK